MMVIWAALEKLAGSLVSVIIVYVEQAFNIPSSLAL